ncbi:Ribosomal protein L18 [Dillenia turbinata]|uniref:Ribosomal protein L18 n=1 Tax=Dillenia turbinata TaxID=194707 RepID=A0AAN8ZDQ0_9MAGN
MATTVVLLRRCVSSKQLENSHILSRVCRYGSSFSTKNDIKKELTQPHLNDNKKFTPGNFSAGIQLSPLFLDSRAHSDSYKIKVVDSDVWRVSSSLAQAWQGTNGFSELSSSCSEGVDNASYSSYIGQGDPDFDEIDDMRVKGNLFYKLDRGSKEFEEYSFDFHGRKNSSKNKNDGNKNKAKEKEKPTCSLPPRYEKVQEVVKKQLNTLSLVNQTDVSRVGKKIRTPTFNQLTGPYHEPFCLDIYISKSSVRACIVHRVTSKVVAVAHSISKDMKFDLGSTKDSAACAAVGGVLAQRALADDIHDVIYTPRKGDKLEGKLQIVLQSIIDNGVNVELKLKQRRPKKAVRQLDSSSSSGMILIWQSARGYDEHNNA